MQNCGNKYKKQSLLVKTFKTGNSKGHNDVNRKRVPNVNDPTSKEVTISFGNNVMLI